MEALTQQKYEELKSDEPIKSKFHPSTKNHTNKSYIPIEPTDTDGNYEDSDDSTDIHAMRLETELVELYDSDDDGKNKQVMIEKQVESEGY
eukprot:69111_1